MSESNNESSTEISRYLRKHNFKYDYSFEADDSRIYLLKTSERAINEDTTKYSYIQIRIYQPSGSLYSAYSQCMGDFNQRKFVDSFPLKKNEYPFINTRLRFEDELELIQCDLQTKNELSAHSGKVPYTYVVYYSIWTSYLAKHVLKEISRVESEHKEEVLVILVNLANDSPTANTH